MSEMEKICTEKEIEGLDMDSPSKEKKQLEIFYI